MKNAGAKLLLMTPWPIFLLAASPAAAGTVEDFRIWGNVTAIAKLGSLDPRLDKWRWRSRDASGTGAMRWIRTSCAPAWVTPSRTAPAT